jgi:hypothetical protein
MLLLVWQLVESVERWHNEQCDDYGWSGLGDLRAKTILTGALTTFPQIPVVCPRFLKSGCTQSWRQINKKGVRLALAAYS